MVKQKKTSDVRKGMKMYELWVSVEEKKSIETYLDVLPSVVWKIVVEARKKGNFYVKKKKVGGKKE